ncbi:MAG: MoxR family ATPase [Ectothiorhodospiraceae bacterium]|nr:MoxR family ATPase [Ectothiorhodospiraceae bacterium]
MNHSAMDFATELESLIGGAVFGAQEVIRGLSAALIADGHVLLEGVPGVGKTLLAKTLAGALGKEFKRVQGTADLMPSDITGVHVYNAEGRRFELMPGPLFAELVLVDEINRSGPKTQSALLQAMEERAVTIDRETYRLPEGFFVIAAQNPHEFEGTYPLPESQLDRFLMRLRMTYPDADESIRILQAYDRPGAGHAQPAAPASLDGELLAAARAQAAELHVEPAIYRYVNDIGEASRTHPRISLGLSTRGTLALMRCARAAAAIRGSGFVTPDDVKQVAPLVIPHRLVLAPDASLDGVSPEAVCDDLLEQVPVPRG